jgi:hypothetical protein
MRFRPAIGLFFFFAVAALGDEINHTVMERLRTNTDDRDRSTDLKIYSYDAGPPLAARASVNFSIQDEVHGSRALTVESVYFQREMEITKAEARGILDRLIKAGLLGLPKSYEKRTDYYWGISGIVRNREIALLSYDTPPRQGTRRRVDAVLKQIPHELGIDKIEGRAYAIIKRDGGRIRLVGSKTNEPWTNEPAVTVMEGDLRPRAFAFRRINGLALTERFLRVRLATSECGRGTRTGHWIRCYPQAVTFRVHCFA